MGESRLSQRLERSACLQANAISIVRSAVLLYSLLLKLSLSLSHLPELAGSADFQLMFSCRLADDFDLNSRKLRREFSHSVLNFLCDLFLGEKGESIDLMKVFLPCSFEYRILESVCENITFSNFDHKYNIPF